jgi:hypothetical protein
VKGKDTPFKHCYLQLDAFAPGTGYYGKAEATGFSGYTSGRVADRFVKNGQASVLPWVLEATAAPASAVGGGKEFHLTIHGAGLPYAPEAAKDGSAMQRVKLVEKGSPCTAPLPKEVSGLYCVEASARGKAVSALCGPAPVEATAKSAKFGPITIAKAEVERSYDVCYCPRDCIESSRWQKAPAPMTVPASVLTWDTVVGGASVQKVGRVTSGLEVVVTAPDSATSLSANDGWELKLVRDWYGCGVEMDTTIFDNITTTRRLDLSNPLFHYYYYKWDEWRGVYTFTEPPTSAPAVLTRVGYSDRADSSVSIYGTTSCTGPNQCTWTFDVSATVEQAGTYFVCFRQSSGADWSPLPSKTGLKGIDVVTLTTDHEEPVGIFHNQAFSARAGTSASLSLLGSRLPVPTAAALTMTLGACGDLEAFAFGALDKVDDEAPSLLPDSSVPPAGATIKDGLGTAITLVFNEPVVDGNKSFGFYTTGSTPAVVPSAVHFTGNRVVLVATLPAATYYVAAESGAVLDLAGNPLPMIAGGQYSFTVAGGATHPAPTVVAVDPPAGSAADLSNHSGKIRVFFSDTATAVTAVPAHQVTIETLIGDTLVTIDSIPVQALTITDTIMEIEPGAAVKDGKLYVITVPAGIIENGDGVALADDYVFYFEKTASGFSQSHIAFMDPAMSTGTSLSFDLMVGKGTPAGKYNVCYCSGQGDQSLTDLGNGVNTYEGPKEVTCDTHIAASGQTAAFLGATIADHVCEAKCEYGCLGPDCYCSGASEAPDALCLPAYLCAEACDLLAGCIGFDADDTLPICYLVSGCSTETADATSRHFTKVAGTSCTQFSDFTEKAGTLTVTHRVDVGVDYVATPGEKVGMEITGTGLLAGAGGKLTADRVMVIDCGGTCGVTGPSSNLDLPENAGKVETWANFWPSTFFQEGASEDRTNQPDARRVFTAVPPATGLGYYGDSGDENGLEGFFCKGHNLDLSFPVPMQGVERSAAEYGCYDKCRDGCEGDHCFCDGYLSGYDTPTSKAICADEDTCKYLCDSTEDCKSIDMHQDVNRCFLNGPGCELHRTKLDKDPGYTLLVKRQDPNDYKVEGRRLGEDPDANGSPTALPTMDLGFSWGQKLRFAPLRFTSGGTFKLCFCDSTLTGTCSTIADYSVEVGKIHASGLSCLIAKPELQRASCVTMFHGGLRCYKNRDAPDSDPPALAPLLEGEKKDRVLEALTEYCSYQPDDEGCAIVA